MADVIKIAKERRVVLAAELGKLDDFIRMAEALVEWSQSKADRTADIVADTAAAEAEESATLRPQSVAAGAVAK
jgi:hypothetical protein